MSCKSVIVNGKAIRMKGNERKGNKYRKGIRTKSKMLPLFSEIEEIKTDSPDMVFNNLDYSLKCSNICNEVSVRRVLCKMQISTVREWVSKGSGKVELKVGWHCCVQSTVLWLQF